MNVMPIVRMSRSAASWRARSSDEAERVQLLDERGGGRPGLAVLVEQLVPGAGERPQIGHRHVIVPSGRVCRLDVPFVTLCERAERHSAEGAP